MFFLFLNGRSVLLGTDAVISASNLDFYESLDRIRSAWSSTPLLGKPAFPSVNFLNLLLIIVQDGVLWNNWYHGLACLIASGFMLQYLRQKGMSAWASTLAVLAAFWIGVNLTILYAGHPAKPYIVMLFVAALIPVSRAVRGSLAHSLLWGGCIGLMFIHQQDVALFFALFAGAYFVFRLFGELGFKSPRKWIRILTPALIFAFVFACGPLLSGYKTHVANSVQTQVQTPKQKWEYVTQWSFPPEESIVFIAPGYTGWRSGESDGPYWGRMGRSVGWEQTGQGFRNFKLENMYIGFIPVAFALFALFSCYRSKHRAEILFWGGAALVALFLSFGKFFPLYSLFYKLPVVNNIRNPNKFLQVFQVCVAILSAYGFDRLFRSGEWRVASGKESGYAAPLKPETKSLNPSSQPSDLRLLISENRRFFYFLAGILGLLTLWTLSLTLDRSGDMARLMVQGWPQDAAQTISKNKVMALWHASIMAALVAAVFALFSFSRCLKAVGLKRWIAACLILIVAADAFVLSKHYIKTMPRSYIETNALIDFLKKDLKQQRVALVNEQNLFGILKTYTLPYNGIPVFNPGDVSRMSVDYRNFLQATRRDPLGMWEFSAVKYLLAPAGLESQVPSGRVRKVFACAPRSAQDGGFILQSDMVGPLAVFELLNVLPRYALFAGSKKMKDEEALNRIGDLSQLSLRPDSKLPELVGQGQTGRVTVTRYQPGRVTLSVQSEAGGILRSADFYTDGWKAKVDGKLVSVEPVDYICLGAFVPAGSHQVELYYNARKGFLYLQLAGYLVFVLALLWSFQNRSTAGQFEIESMKSPGRYL